MKKIRIGKVTSRPGGIVRGRLDFLELPTGGRDFLPVVLAQGKKDGPCLWITANIHGDENTGLVALHRFLTPALAKRLRGSIVAVPALCPANLRARTRNAYYTGENPNRAFPDFRYERGLLERGPGEAPSALAMAYADLFKWIGGTADFLVDLHNMWFGSIPFAIREWVFYDKKSGRRRAEALGRRTDAMFQAMGLSVTRFGRTPAAAAGQPRTISLSALNVLGIPAIAIELGSYGFVENHNVEAACEALRNVLVWAGMIEGEIQPVRSVPVVDLGYSTVASGMPRSPGTGIIDFQVRPGDIVPKGGRIAILRDVWGRKRADVLAEQDGWIVGTVNDVRAYPNKELGLMAVRDRRPAAARYPSRKRPAR